MFIENQMSFERAVRAGGSSFSGLTLVYASGFKGSAPTGCGYADREPVPALHGWGMYVDQELFSL